MELGHLRCFAAVAEEATFDRAAERLMMDGPSLTRQLGALEQELGVLLVQRGTGPVRLTAEAVALLPDARALLAHVQGMQRHARRLAGAETVRLGYAGRRPSDLEERTAHVAEICVDPTAAPSHTQAARVASGALDVAVCRVEPAELAILGLVAYEAGSDRLHAVAPYGERGTLAPYEIAVLVAPDEPCWTTWNLFADELAESGVEQVPVQDGAIAGPGFLEHVRRLGRPVLASPRDLGSPLPDDLTRLPVADPEIHWSWSVVHRAGEDRPDVLAVADALAGAASSRAISSSRPRSTASR
ncbi:MAG: LysR family transcriptional regulator [Nocardioidaceae bacterium]|nr:LysR family transcriptional regulator [Nocardioidaceae bacterium]